MMSALYDITAPIEDGMVNWPGDPSIQVERICDVACGDTATVSFLHFGSHTGTHVDAFSHFKRDGKTLDEMDLNIYLGPAYVLEMAQDIAVITRSILEAHAVFQSSQWIENPCRRILFKTRNSQSNWSKGSFQKDFVHLDPSASAFLVEQETALVGIDYLSVEGFHAENAPTHHCLMDHQVYILEGLYLQEVPPGWYELICLPLKLKNGDGAPARAVLKTL